LYRAGYLRFVARLYHAAFPGFENLTFSHYKVEFSGLNAFAKHEVEPPPDKCRRGKHNYNCGGDYEFSHDCQFLPNVKEYGKLHAKPGPNASRQFAPGTAYPSIANHTAKLLLLSRPI
jgi:hypothetical protein